MISDIPNVETFHHSEIKNVNELMNVNDNFISKELEINKILPEQQMSFHHTRLYVTIYTTISRTKMKYPIMLLVCYWKLAML